MTRGRPGAGARGLLLATLSIVAACGGERTQQGCRMDHEVVVGVTVRAPQAVALAQAGSARLLAAWSADDEVRVATLDAATLAVRHVRRLERVPQVAGAPSPDAGPKTFWHAEHGSSLAAEDIAVVGFDDGSAGLALLERPRHGRPGGAYVALIPAASEQPIEIERVGAAGEFASRIALAWWAGRFLVSWHEGLPGQSHVGFAALDRRDRTLIGPARVSGASTNSGPAVAARGDRALLAWSATRAVGGEPITEVKVAPVGAGLRLGGDRVVGTCRYLDPTPRLAALGQRFGLLYRDDADEDEKPEFYFAQLDDTGRTLTGPARISRADGFAGPRIAGGEQLVFSAAIRSFQRNYLVGLNRFDLSGEKRGGEFQVYADKSDFIRTDLVANGATVTLVYGEDRRGAGRVMAARVECRDEGAAAAR